MRALRNLLTPPSSPSVPRLDDSASILTEELSFSIPESDDLDTTDAEDSCDVIKAIPRVPPEEIPKPVERRNTDGSTRSADDLLAQVDVLRDSANAARSRRPRFREGSTPYDRKNDDSEHRASTLSRGPEPSLEHALVQTTVHLHDPTMHGEEEAGNAYRSGMHYLSSLSAVPEYPLIPDEEKRARKTGKFFRVPVSFLRRFLCLGHFDGAGRSHLAEFHSPVDRFDSHSCSRFDSLLPVDPLTTRRIRPRSSVVSPCVIDIR